MKNITEKERLRNQDVLSVHVLTEENEEIHTPANRQPLIDARETKKRMESKQNRSKIIKLAEKIDGLLKRVAEGDVVEKIKSVLEQIRAGVGAEYYGAEYYGRHPEPEAKAAITEDVNSLRSVIDDISEVIADGKGNAEVEIIRESCREVCQHLESLTAKELLAEAATELISESIVFVEAIREKDGEPDGSKWQVKAISEGVSKNRFVHQKKNFPQLVGLLEGKKIYANHIPREKQSQLPERPIQEVVGWFSDGKVEGDSIIGTANILESESKLRQDLLQKPDLFGLSIQARGKMRPSRIGNRVVDIVESYTGVTSMDIVNEASAGGEFIRPIAESVNERRISEMSELDKLTDDQVRELFPHLFEEKKPEETVIAEGETGPTEEPTPERSAEASELINLKIEQTQLPEYAKERIREAVDGDKGLGLEGAKDLIQREVEYAGKAEAALKADKGEEDKPLIESVAGGSSEEKLFDAWLAFMGPGQNHLKYNPRDLWIQTTGDVGLQMKDSPTSRRKLASASAHLREVHVKNIREGHTEEFRGWAPHMQFAGAEDMIAEATRANWSAYFGDIIHMSMLEWSKQDPVASFRKDIDTIVTKVRLEDYEDFDAYIMQGLDAFDVVTEGNPFTEFGGGLAVDSTSFVAAKRGNIFTISKEMLLGDKIGLLRQIPKNIAYVCWYTLWNWVFNTSIAANPNMSYDAAALFVGAHANTDANALTNANLVTGLQKMRAQTLPGAAATFPMRIMPKYLLAGPYIMQLAEELLGTDVKRVDGVTEFSSTLPNFINKYGLKDYMILDFLTVGGADQDHWFICADPAVHDVFLLGFVGGQDQPNLITQDNPLTGSVFTNDAITYRVDWSFGGSPGRHEYWYGGLP